MTGYELENDIIATDEIKLGRGYSDRSRLHQLIGEVADGWVDVSAGPVADAAVERREWRETCPTIYSRDVAPGGCRKIKSKRV